MNHRYLASSLALVLGLSPILAVAGDFDPRSMPRSDQDQDVRDFDKMIGAVGFAYDEETKRIYAISLRTDQDELVGNPEGYTREELKTTLGKFVLAGVVDDLYLHLLAAPTFMASLTALAGIPAAVAGACPVVGLLSMCVDEMMRIADDRELLEHAADRSDSDELQIYTVREYTGKFMRCDSWANNPTMENESPKYCAGLSHPESQDAYRQRYKQLKFVEAMNKRYNVEKLAERVQAFSGSGD